MRVGLLTGGGDCPGLNAVIRAVARQVANASGSTVGIMEGWRGLVQGLAIELAVPETDDLVARGGTILGASRTNPYKDAEQDIPKLREQFGRLGLDALIVVGGDDTLAVASRLHADFAMPVVGVPKTIDNDLAVTDVTFGFDTAVNVVVEAIDRLRTTSESHRRVMVVETMGRQTGWIALHAGVAAAADYILVPEIPADLVACAEALKRRRQQGKRSGIVVISEGVKLPTEPVDEGSGLGDRRAGLGGVGASMAHALERATGFETRSVALGHIQRGGSPSAYDRILATRFGLAAADLAIRGRFGTVVALRDQRLVEVPLTREVANLKTLDLDLYQEASAFFG